MSRKPLSVDFLGWEHVFPPTPSEVAALELRYGLKGATHSFRAGDCALLAVTNNDTRDLCFETLAVEYKTEERWIRVVPKQWPWFRGQAWSGKGTTLKVPRPAEVPRLARWRIQFVCTSNGETGFGHGARSNRSMKMVTPNIPPMELGPGADK